MRAFIALLSLAAVASAGRLYFDECNAAENGEVLEVSCEQFADYAEVILKRGQTYDFTIKFKAGESSVYLVPEIHGVIAGIQVQMQGIPPHACGSLTGNKCPLVSGQEYSYSVGLPITSSHPALPLTLSWALVSADENANKGNKQICFTMPARITA